MTYHDGELEMQRRAGVRQLADRVGRIISADIPAAAAAFLAMQRFVIVSTTDGGGIVTASLLGGPPAFAHAPDERTVVIRPEVGPIDTVAADVDASGQVGLLAIDLASRRRMRVNGTARRDGDAIVVSTREVYSNCPQYIRPRRFGPPAAASRRSMSDTLTTRHQNWISASDTFFLATSHPERGNDASHRGGPAGFVTVETPGRISWPDFPGNNMFNSLGNLLLSSRCGLLFVDFTSGSTLQVRGTGRVEGESERVVSVEIDAVIETV